ncbi:leucine--tRNA ligase [Buchnera aphidicola (Pseudoregma panicola)]|uniref:leucine--tRNA ligase n=1 Tax=Buchnera aphidicola TaxID=9 RepID=UPI0031B6C415
MIKQYDHKKIENSVQKYWKKKKYFKVCTDKKRKKYYCLSMFPYPSGNLHMGHIRNYTISDIIARYNRMLNKNVLHPIGWDSFGLPAEEAAIKNNVEPHKWTLKNIKNMKKQLKSMGFSYDWSREISTCDPEFYKWEQYIFIKLYKKKIVYKKKSLVNWCENDKTVLANEQVINKRCWRCNNKVKMKKMNQWFIKTKKYAKRLLEDMKYLKKWPKKVIAMQKKWIGYKKKIKILIKIKNNNKIFVYISRLDTICGATFILLFYKSKFIKKNIKKNINIKKIFEKCNEKKKKNINFAYKTNFNAIHPITNKKIPIWISNYFLDKDFKKKSILACPAHNMSEWFFAKKYKIKIKFVIKNIIKEKNEFYKKPILYKGILYNSYKKINGLCSEKATKIIKKKLNKITKIYIKNTFKIKDWNISRQRYWGCPIPIVTLKNKKLSCVSKKTLPIIFKNVRKKYNKKRKILVNGKLGILEKDTFDTFIESSWYYIRYASPKYKKGIVNPKDSKYWLPVDFYVGGIEHATMHLIYFRIYCKILKDLKIIKFDEPVKSLICQGMVLSETFYKISNGKKIWVSKDKIKIIKNKKGKIKKIINKVDKKKIHYLGMTKMSKSKNNGIEPKNIIKKYGSDSLRLFITFSAPVENSIEWKSEGINGSYKFIKKIWILSNLILKKNKISKIDHNSLNEEQKKIRSKVHHIIVKISKNMKKKKYFNNSISEIMKIVKKIEKFNNKKNSLIIIESFLIILKLLNPFIPHVIFYIFKKFNILYKLKKKCWPTPDKKSIIENFCKIIVQINGKKRYIINAKKNIKEKKILKIIMQKKNLKKYLKNTKIKKTIFVKNKIINILTI